MGTNSQVTILQRTLTDYRLAFFDELFKRLQNIGISLVVHAGESCSQEYLADQSVERSYLKRVHNRYLFRKIYWQDDSFFNTRSSDLVIFEQANSALYSYALIIRRLLGKDMPMVSFWGHGRDFSKSSPNGASERWKHFWTTRVDFWFCYTKISATEVEKRGFCAERIAVINNTTDVLSLADAVDAVNHEVQLASHYDLWHEVRHDKHRVAVFCSRLLPSKGLDLLKEATTLIHNQYQDFRLLVIGDGPLHKEIETFANDNPWCAYHKPVYGVERAPLLSLADMWLNPGTTGLAIIDAFACGVPFITTMRNGHGPELAYLTNDNGLLLDATADTVARAVLDLLRIPKKLLELKQGARQSASKYTIESMVDHFVAGIVYCLNEIKED